MKREVQSSFEKYYLGGLNNKSLVTTNDGVSIFNGTDENNTLFTKVSWKNNTYPEGDIALYDNEQFYKFLSLYDDEDEKFEMVFEKRGDMYNKVIMKGSNYAKVNYYLADPSILDKPKKLKKISEWNVSFKIKPKELQTILKAANATSLADLVFVTEKGISIGTRHQASNKVDMTLEEYNISNLGMDGKEFCFSLKHFTTILSTIKDEVQIDVMERIMKITYSKDDLNCEYVLAALISV